MIESNEAERDGGNVAWRWWGLLFFLLIVLPQANFVAISVLQQWPFGNMIRGTQDFIVVYVLLGLSSGLAVYSGFLVFLFVFLFRTLWWKRLGYLALYLAAHLIVTAAAFHLFRRSSPTIAEAGVIEIGVQSGHLWQAPLLGSTVLFAAVLVQWFFGWRLVSSTSEGSASPITVSTLLEGVAACGIVFACWYQVSGIEPGEDVNIEIFDFGMAIFPALGIVVSSLILVRFLLGPATWRRSIASVVCLVLVQAGVYAGAWLVLGWSDFGSSDPMLLIAPLAPVIVSAVATICLLPCWYCLKAMGYRLTTYRDNLQTASV